MMDFEQQIRLHYDHLNDNEQEMLRFIRQNKQVVLSKNINELGKLLLTSKSSVLRLAKKLGFKGFKEMKYALSESEFHAFDHPKGDFVHQMENDILKTFQYAKSLNFIPILEKLREAKNVYIYATGFSQNNFSKEFSNDLLLCFRSNFLISGETNFDLLSATMTKEDFVIVVSLSGETAAIKPIVQKLLLNDVPILGITQFGDNFLRRHSTYQLFYEASPIDRDDSFTGQSMAALSVILMILSRKYREFIS